MTLIGPFSTKDFFRKVHTVKFFTLRQSGKSKKYLTKRPDATSKERRAFRSPETQEWPTVTCSPAPRSSGHKMPYHVVPTHSEHEHFRRITYNTLASDHRVNLPPDMQHPALVCPPHKPSAAARPSVAEKGGSGGLPRLRQTYSHERLRRSNNAQRRGQTQR